MVKELHIFSTTDVHGELNQGYFPALEMMKQSANALRIDNGDFLAGRPFATFGRIKGGKSPLVDLANEAGYDVMIPGNHDFDYGIAWLKEQVKYLNATYLCANVYDADWNLLFQPYTVIEKAGLKIGVVGLMTEALNQLVPLAYHATIRTRPVADVLPAILQELATCDLIVVAYHGGLSRDPNTGAVLTYPSLEDNAYEIASQFPEIDILICGHQHFRNSGKHPESGTTIIQAGSHGQAVGQQIIKDKQVVANQLWDFTDKADYYPPDYYQWVKEPINLDEVYQYIHEHYPGDFHLINYQAKTIGELAEETKLAFPLKRYLIKGHELLQLGLVDAVPDDEQLFTVIATPDLLPNTYLVESYLINLFSDLMIALYKA